MMIKRGPCIFSHHGIHDDDDDDDDDDVRFKDHKLPSSISFTLRLASSGRWGIFTKISILWGKRGWISLDPLKNHPLVIMLGKNNISKRCAFRKLVHGGYTFLGRINV